MKFGINILNYGPRSDPETFKQWALFAEEVGYHLVMISDHVANTSDVQEVFPVPFYDPFVTLAWLAGLTHKVELGTTVAILPYRHPLLTARLAANLDQLSHGRFILGVGIGWAQQEFEALGIPFRQRGGLSDEYMEVTERPLPEASRVAGQGTLDQVRADLAGLAALGATYVLLDTFVGYADERLAQPERAWEMLALLADEVLDLAQEGLR
jgi:alkanesulfonate monooxygenase SsuD/methylene tetrahydromethanopterin reductase-like flavin-dependent oxidoreductase (luciferase family)